MLLRLLSLYSHAGFGLELASSPRLFRFEGQFRNHVFQVFVLNSEAFDSRLELLGAARQRLQAVVRQVILIAAAAAGAGLSSALLLEGVLGLAQNHALKLGQERGVQLRIRFHILKVLIKSCEPGTVFSR